jgi:NAD(P)-dependent dehydrogenase (short-subunit alcohol dehydrogenase family)
MKRIVPDPETSAAKDHPRTVWVTGSGAHRVGRAVATHFYDLGYNVALHAHRSLDEANQTADRWNLTELRAIVTEGAIDDSSTSARSVAQIVDAFGRLDVLVHCAAIWDWRSLEETTAEDVRRQFDVNTLGTYLCAQQAGLQMVGQTHGGAIILVGDWAVARPYRDFSAYFAGKGAIETLVRSFAVELATRNPNIRVNGVLPGPVMLDESTSPARADRILESCLLKRHGTPEDVARAAYFLAHQEFITGVCLPVDGGRSIWAGPGADAVAHPRWGEVKDEG